MPNAAARPPLDTPAVWRAADLASATEWRVELTPRQRDEIVRAAATARAAGATASTIRRDQFPLPRLADDIAGWASAVHHRRGVLLLRGFPVDELDDAGTELAYIGFGTHFGRPVGQNVAGDLLTHVRDERLPASSTVRLYRTNARQDFHTDGADVIGLLCLRPALRGGESKVVSSGALYNEMLARRPDLLDELYRPFHWDRQGEEAPGERPWFSLAPLHDLDGRPRLFYLGWYIRDAQRHLDVPRLTDAQLEAMEMLEELANDPTFHVTMEFERGDVQLIDNGLVLHAREAYDDHDDPALRRHLLRLWLAAHTFASVEEGLRRGIGPDAVS